MKSSVIKTIIVKLAPDNIYEIDVDSDIFEDPFFEAATRAVEQCRVKKYGLIRHITECWEKKYAKQIKKRHLFNSYWVLINASLFKKAESLREKFKHQTDFDLSKAPARGIIEYT